MERIVTKDDYLQSLREQGHLVYYNGEQVKDVTSHPAFRPHINAAAKTYEMALMPEYEDLATAISHLTGERISRFTHIHQSVEDLIKKVQLLRAIAHETGSCFQRCVGWDALNATYMTTYDIDQKHGTDYHQRFLEYLKYIQATNKMVVGGMTDTKGDRSLPPHKQKDLDVFTRRGGAPRRRHHHPGQQGPPDRRGQQPRDTHHAHPVHARGRRRLRPVLRHPPQRARRGADLRPPDQRRPPHDTAPWTRATRSTAWWAARRSSCSRTCSCPGSGCSCAARPSSPACWWSASPPCTARTTAAARAG